EAALVCLGAQGSRGPSAIAGEAAAMRAELSKLAVNLATEQIGGLADLAAAATEPLTTTSAALLDLAQLVGSRFGLRLAIADCGASQTTVAYATPDQSSARMSLYDQPLRDIPTTTDEARRLQERLQTALGTCVAEGFAADLVVGTGALAHSVRWSEAAL